MKIIFLLFSLLFSILTFAQQDTLGKTRYTPEFRFKTGIFMSFEEFQHNEPSIINFRIKKKGNFNDGIIFEYKCEDDSNLWCETENCWGYSENGNVYISQKFANKYFRIQIIGALIHYIRFDGYDYRDMGYSYNYYMQTTAVPRFNEFFLDFDTGNSYLFTYKIFSEFLKNKDEELYKKLMNTKKKKKIYTHFLFKYNEKHPIYF
ncbi:MAG: hypothetical protein CVT95_13060 [Bacteroidetes bacterium HGW-Bacteroidetes-12]|nr:MAG: hypothetical protein CVT95_13060 [Bacteroidetes bacterium HGW-Bacteroidetes-12]